MSEARARAQAAARSRRIAEEAAGWYLDQQEGLTPEGQADFLCWLQHSPSHVAEYLAMAQLHGDLRAVADESQLTLEQLCRLAASESPVVPLRRAQQETPAPEPTRVQPSATRQPRSRPRLRQVGWAIAASVAMLSCAAVAWRMHAPSPARIYASGPAVNMLTLPDGSLVQLDQSSAIAVRFDAGHRDIEVLRGGAMFDVGKDPRPLQVRLGANLLQDTGTVFEARRRGNEGIVTVISGEVNLLAPQSSWASAWQRLSGRGETFPNVIAPLGSGQQAHLNARGELTGVNGHANLAQATQWLPGNLHFQHSTVAEVARRFDAYTRQPLVIEDSKLATMRISGVFHARDVDAFLGYLSTFPGVQVQRRRDRVLVSRRPRPGPHRL